MTRRFTAITVALIVLVALLIISQIAATVAWWLVPGTQSVISSAQYAGVPNDCCWRRGCHALFHRLDRRRAEAQVGCNCRRRHRGLRPSYRFFFYPQQYSMR